MADDYTKIKTLDCLTRWQQLKTERATFFSHWAEITNFLLPRNGRYFVQDRNRGHKRHNNIIDRAGTGALKVLSAGMMAGMTSPARPWFRMETRDPDLMKSGPVKIWLSQVTQTILDVFHDGNTYRSLHAMYSELGAFGTAAAVVLEDYDDVMRHYTLTAGEYCIAQNWRGDTDTLYREFQKTVVEVVKEFGIDKVSPAVKRMYDNGNLGAWVTIIQAIEPRADRDPRIKTADHKAWASVYYEVGADKDKPLRNSGFDYFNALAPRWDVAGGDIYGNSPGMDALGLVKQLQQEQLRKSMGIDYMTKPPLQMPTGMKNREVDGLPGGITYLDSTQAPGARNLFQVQLDLSHLLADIQDVRGGINSCFYADLFQMISSQPADGRMTATEVAERHEEKLLMLGPVLERLNDEMLSPLVRMTFQRALKAGILPPPPPELNMQQLNIKFVSMLAQAQRAIGTNSIDRYVGSLGAVAQFKPDVLDKFDSDAWADAYAEMLGVDPTMIVPSKDAALVRDNRAQMQARAQQSALQNQAADTAQKLAQVPTQGGQSNAAYDVMNQVSGYTSPSPERI